MNNKINIRILKEQAEHFLKEDGTFNMEEALLISGRYAGVCYNKDGYSELESEPQEKTMKRVMRTLTSGHHSVFDHIYITFNFDNIPKILAMVLNNEKQYTTSEKSARYTPIIKTEGSIITEEEEYLYQKWKNILKIKIDNEYGKYSTVFTKSKIDKLAGENARYMVTVFMPTCMIYTTSLRQINYIASFMKKYIDASDKKDYFEKNLSSSMQDFIDELDRLHILNEELMKNEKNRKLSLFEEDLMDKEEYFGDVYSHKYQASFAEYAQAQRHRSITYHLELMKNPKYFLPPILENDPVLAEEWLKDMEKVGSLYPQGELVNVFETGTLDNFILKCKERICSHPQLEIARQEKVTLTKYLEALKERNERLYQKLKPYSYGARCTFSDYQCNEDCQFKEGKTLTRKI